jgi:class 3 adenylate cyclase/TM2 domain-containing membrane protein YozV
MEQQKQRKLAAIVFTDIVGYSAIMESNEQEGIQMRTRHRQVFSELTKEFQGEILQYFGDGTLSIFDSAAAAVECAVEMQKKFQDSPKVPLRIGIHTGDVTYTLDDAYGHGMNIAARIEPMCIPGGIYVSGKVYDDIRNHPYLTAESIGFYELKNINEAIEIYAVTNDGVNKPKYELDKHRKKAREEQDEQAPTVTPQAPAYVMGTKNRKRAGILALIFGIFGIHRHYLGQRVLGIIYFVSFILGVASEGELWPLIVIPAIVGFIDAIVLLSMSDQDFNIKYNKMPVTIPVQVPQKQKEEKVKLPELPELQPKRKITQRVKQISEDLPLIDRANKKLRIGDSEGAISDFAILLAEDPKNSDLHFNLACAYSLKQEAEKGFFHLSKAVEYGYKDFRRIENHYTLAYLRSNSDFDSFARNGYRLVKMLPSPQETLLDSERPELMEKLERIEELGERLFKGEISEEEFTAQKRKLLE